MKTKLVNGCHLAGLLALVWASAPAGQTLSREEESALLVASVNAGEYVTALEILRAHGVTNGTLEAMAARLGRPPQRVPLAEPFLKGWEPAPTRAWAQDTFLEPRVAAAAALGYPRLVWMVDSLGAGGMQLREAQYRQSVVPPIGVLDVSAGETNVMGFFLWYDRYAERLHSVALNWENLNNRETADHTQARMLLHALFQLVKARKPDAFVWLTVKPSVDYSDAQWLATMQFGYDGLMVMGELADFRSPFEQTRRRYLPLVGEERPMVAGEFCGYNHALRRAAKISGGRGPGGIETIQDPAKRQAAREREAAAYAGVGRVVGPHLGRLEQRLQALGYRGLILDSRLVRALSEAAAER